MKYAEQMPDGTLDTYDDFPVRVYTEYILLPTDVVAVSPNPMVWPAVWGEVIQDTEDDAVKVRELGTNYEFWTSRSFIRYERIHKCECGAYGGESWRICHPDA